MKTKLLSVLLFGFLFANSQVVKNQEWEFNNKVTLNGSVVIPTGASNGDVLTSDGSGNATWQASGSSAIQSSTVTVSAAQILALHTTPITIVAAQGANTVIVPISMTVEYIYVSAAYATDQTLIFTYGGGTWLTLSSALALTQNTFYFRNLQQNAGVSGSNTYSNGAFKITTPTSNPTAGNATLKITMYYAVSNL